MRSSSVSRARRNRVHDVRVRSDNQSFSGSERIWKDRKRRRSPFNPVTRFAILCALYLVFASAIGAGAAHMLHSRSKAGAPAAPPIVPKYLVLMVLDGARPDYFGLTPLPHLDALRAAGVQYTRAFTGILESETPSGHAAIASGSRPDRNGLLGFDWGANGSRYSLFSPDQMGTVESLLQAAHVPTLASLYKARYPTARVVALSGHKYYAAAPLGGPSADAIMYYQGDPKGRYVPVAVPGHTPPASVLNDPSLIYPSITLKDGVENDLTTKLALKTVDAMHPRMLLINYPEFDWPLGHVDGGNLDRGKVIADMKVLDRNLGEIEAKYKAEGILDKTLFVITADHGMMPITHFIPASIVTNAISQAGTTTPDVAASTADYVWLADGNKAQAVADNILAAHDPGIDSVYYLVTANGMPGYVAATGSKATGGLETANQYLLNSLLNGHEPSVVAFATPGGSFSDPKSNWKADHGGDTWQAQSIPLIVSGAGIRAGMMSSAPAQLEDIAPTALTAMGVKPSGMQGHVLTEALLQSNVAARKPRSSEEQQLAPVVGGLTAQDGATTGQTP